MAENPVPVCATADVPPGSVKSFEVGDERVAIYQRLAAVTVPTDDLDPDEIADQIAAEITTA